MIDDDIEDIRKEIYQIKRIRDFKDFSDKDSALKKQLKLDEYKQIKGQNIEFRLNDWQMNSRSTGEHKSKIKKIRKIVKREQKSLKPRISPPPKKPKSKSQNFRPVWMPSSNAGASNAPDKMRKMKFKFEPRNRFQD